MSVRYQICAMAKLAPPLCFTPLLSVATTTLLTQRSRGYYCSAEKLLKSREEISSNYPYGPPFVNQPWKLTRSSCGENLPRNDFGKFYLSALDERGLFKAANGNRTSLCNVENPGPDDPLYRYGANDGYEYIDENGRQHRFIRYYTWKYWMHTNTGLELLADAFS